MIRIIEAGRDQLDEVAALFDAYRVFYKQPPDLKRAKEFIGQRISEQDSRIFLAYWEDQPAGFTQLFPSFSSVSAQPLYILNDLYVAENARNNGIASALLEHAKQICLEEGRKGLALETAADNPAQVLYERLGWKKDTTCFHYFWTAGT